MPQRLRRDAELTRDRRQGLAAGSIQSDRVLPELPRIRFVALPTETSSVWRSATHSQGSPRKRVNFIGIVSRSTGRSRDECHWSVDADADRVAGDAVPALVDGLAALEDTQCEGRSCSEDLGHLRSAQSSGGECEFEQDRGLSDRLAPPLGSSVIWQVVEVGWPTRVICI
jgi:hypothetical protein